MLQLCFSRVRQLAGLALVLGVIGCSSETSAPSAKPQAEGDPVAANDSASASTEADASAEFVLGNALPKFDPPTLEELDKLTWSDSPVRDAMQVMREERAQAGEPSATVEEALALKNDSPENNQKIKEALGVLAPEDGSGVDYNAKLVRHTPGDVNSTNPLFSSSVTDADLNDLTCMYLINFDKQLRYFTPSELVESWQTSEDHMIDRFKLRTDLTWSDGKPFTAHDIEFTFRLIMTDHPLLVIPAIRESGVNQIKYMKAYDDKTLVVFHIEPAEHELPHHAQAHLRGVGARGPVAQAERAAHGAGGSPRVSGAVRIHQPQARRGVRRASPRGLLHARG
jgi:peptide/nickel transport system substrate-binding protein